MTINGVSVITFTNEFVASENKELQSYRYVGLPMEEFSPASDSITLTDQCAFG